MKSKGKAVIGRPSLRTDAVIKELCDRLADGEPMQAICRQAHMPAVRTIMDWIASDEDLSARVAGARELGGDAIAWAALSIADERDEDPASRRVMVETRLKLLACWHPKRYGTKIGLTDGDGKALAAPIINVGFISPAKSDA
jgi:hypothetical protein